MIVSCEDKGRHETREWAQQQADTLNTSLRYSRVSGHLRAYVPPAPCERCGGFHIAYRERGVGE